MFSDPNKPSPYSFKGPNSHPYPMPPPPPPPPSPSAQSQETSGFLPRPPPAYGQASSPFGYNMPPPSGSLQGLGFSHPPSSFYHRGGGQFPQPQHHTPRPPTNSVYCGRVTSEISDDELRSLFEPFGTVLWITRIHHNSTAFIQYPSIEESSTAVHTLRGRNEYGFIIGFGRHNDLDQTGTPQARLLPPQQIFQQPREVRVLERAKRNGTPSCVLFISGLPLNFGDDQIAEHFGEFGPIRTIRRVEIRGFIFVEFDTTEQATAAIEKMGDTELEGHQLYLGFGRPMSEIEEGHEEELNGPIVDGKPAETNASNVLWIGSVPPDTTQTDITCIYGGLEGYVGVVMLHDKGFCFVHFDTTEDTVRAKRKTTGTQIRGQVLKLGFGRHNYGRFGKDGAGPGLGGESALGSDPSGAAGEIGPGGGATLPTEASLAKELSAMGLKPTYATAKRPPPHVSLENRLSSLCVASYYTLFAHPPLLQRPRIHKLCNLIDDTTNERTAEFLLAELHESTNPNHAMYIIARRAKEYFSTDPHRLLYLAYTSACFVHDAPHPSEYILPLLHVFGAALTGQSAEGTAHLLPVIESFRTYLPSEDVEFVCSYFDETVNKARASMDLANLLKHVKKAEHDVEASDETELDNE